MSAVRNLEGVSSSADMATINDQILIENCGKQVCRIQCKMVNNEIALFLVEEQDSANYKRKIGALKEIR